MRYYITFLGLITTFALEGFTANVEIHRNITVKPTPVPLLNPADREDVTMNCTCSRYDIRYYIKHKVRWTFIANSGKEIILTDSFHLTEDAIKSFNYPNTRLLLLYHGYIKGFKFGITIRGVTRADNGIYRCSLVDEDSRVIDSKDVKLTVVNRVERIQIELYKFNPHHDPVSASDSAVSQSSQTLKIEPGQYMVKCRTHGSNPDPVMALYLNGQKLNVSIKSTQHKSSKFETYTGSLRAHRLKINVRDTSQTLVCKANIPGDFYPPSEARILLLVQTTKPTLRYENSSVAVTDNIGTLMRNDFVDGNKEYPSTLRYTTTASASVISSLHVMVYLALALI